MPKPAGTLKNIMFAAILWMTVPVALFSYYNFIWLDNQQQFETNRKFRALDEMSRSFEVTLNSIPGIMRSDHQDIIHGTEGAEIKDRFLKNRSRELEREINQLTAEINRHQALINVYEKETSGDKPSTLKHMQLQQNNALVELKNLRMDLSNIIASSPSNPNKKQNDEDYKTQIQGYNVKLAKQIRTLDKTITAKIEIIDKYDQSWLDFGWFDRTLLNSGKILIGRNKSQNLKSQYHKLPPLLSKIKILCHVLQVDESYSCFTPPFQYENVKPEKKHPLILNDLNQEKLKLNTIEKYIRRIEDIEKHSKDYLPDEEDIDFLGKPAELNIPDIKALKKKIEMGALDKILKDGFGLIEKAQENQKKIINEYVKFREYEDAKKEKESLIEKETKEIQAIIDSITEWRVANGLVGDTGIKYHEALAKLNLAITKRKQVDILKIQIDDKLKEDENKPNEDENKLEEDENKPNEDETDPYGIRKYTQTKGAVYFEHFKYDAVDRLPYLYRDGKTCPEKEEDYIISVKEDDTGFLITACLYFSEKVDKQTLKNALKRAKKHIAKSIEQALGLRKKHSRKIIELALTQDEGLKIEKIAKIIEKSIKKTEDQIVIQGREKAEKAFEHYENLKKDVAQEKNTQEQIDLSNQLLKVTAAWSFKDIGHLFDNYIQQTASEDNAFEGVLLVSKNREVIQSFGETSISFSNLNFLEKATSSLLDIAKSKINASEKAAEQELIRTGALSHSTLWQTKIGTTAYRLYIRPVKIRISGGSKIDIEQQKNKDGQGSKVNSIGYIIGYEEQINFKASISRIPPLITALITVIIILGLLALPVMRLIFSKEWDAITERDAFTTLFFNLIFFSIIIISGLTWAHREAFLDKVDEVSKEILNEMATQFQIEVVKAYEISENLEHLLFKNTKDDKAYLLPLWEGDNKKKRGKIIFPDCHRLSIKYKNLGWRSNKEPLTELCISEEGNIEERFKYPEFQEIFALTENGFLTGNALNNRRSLAALKSLEDRTYFRKARFGPLWENFKKDKEDKPYPLYIERIISRSEGSKITAIAKRAKENKKAYETVCAKGTNSTKEVPCFTAPSVIAQTRKMKTFWQTILPPDFDFAVIESKTGNVIYHSKDHRSLVENFYIETDHNKQLKIATMAHSLSRPMTVFYRGIDSRIRTKPLNNTPWSIVMIYDKSTMEKLWMNSLFISGLIMSSLITFYALLILLFTLLNRSKKDTIESHSSMQLLCWPTLTIRRRYALFSIFLTALAGWQVYALWYRPYEEVLVPFVLIILGFIILIICLLGGRIFAAILDYIKKLPPEVTQEKKSGLLENARKFFSWSRRKDKSTNNNSSNQSFLYGNSTFILLTVTVISMAALPSAATFNIISADRLIQFEKYTLEHFQRACVDRKNAIFREAIAKSLIRQHFTKPPEIEKFQIFKQGEHAFFGYNSNKPYTVCSGKPFSSEKYNAPKASTSHLNFLPATISFLEQSDIGLLRLPYSSEEKPQIPITLDLYGIFEGSFFLKFLTGLVILLLLWASCSYLQIINLHLFGRRLALKTLAKGPALNNEKNFLIMAATEGGFLFKKSDGITPETLHNYNNEEKLYLYNIEPCLIDKYKRTVFLGRLEDYIAQNSSALVRLYCKMDIIDFFDNPQHFPDIILSLLKASDIDAPDNKIEKTHPTALSLTKTDAQKVIGLTPHELSRWRTLLGSFETYWAGLQDTNSEDHWPEIINYEKTTPKDSYSIREINHIIVDRARNLFEEVWNNRTFQEKVALFHLSRGDLLHYSAKPTILNLARFGILEDKRPFGIKCPYFAHFIRERKDIRYQAAQVHESQKLWKKFRTPIIIFLLVIVIFIVFVGGKGFMESMESAIALFGAFIALAFRFLPFGRK